MHFVLLHKSVARSTWSF